MVSPTRTELSRAAVPPAERAPIDGYAWSLVRRATARMTPGVACGCGMVAR